MNVIWIILAVLSFVGGLVYLFFCLRRFDKRQEGRSSHEPTVAYDDNCRYLGEDVIE